MEKGVPLTLKAGMTATVVGHVENIMHEEDNEFDGVLTAVMRDIKEQVTCKLNDTSESGAEEPFVYYDRLNTVYSGSDYVKNGRFKFTFAVPKDIKYSDQNALMNLYAVNTAKTIMANGIASRRILNMQPTRTNSALRSLILWQRSATKTVSTPLEVASVMTSSW